MVNVLLARRTIPGFAAAILCPSRQELVGAARSISALHICAICATTCVGSRAAFTDPVKGRTCGLSAVVTVLADDRRAPEFWHRVKRVALATHAAVCQGDVMGSEEFQ
jgi:hypothetical protein